MPRIGAWIVGIWIALSLGGALVVLANRPGRPVTYHATRRLGPAHRIVAADLRPAPPANSPLLARYVRDAAIEKDDSVRAEYLTTAPQIQIPAGRLPAFARLTPELADALNADSYVDVWSGDKCLLSDTKVQAVVCESGVCSAVFAVEPALAGEMNQSGLKILIRLY